MQKMLTKQGIIEDLKRFGLESGAAVEVHSSLRSMGFVDGGAPAVIQALLEVVGEEGAIVMSCYRVTPPLPLSEEEKARGIIAKVHFLDENDGSKTGMGVISDTFRTWPGTCLGKDIHRVCAWGKNAHVHSQGYENLLSIDGWVLLIGVDINRCSSMHTAEDKVEWPTELIKALRLPDEIQQQYPDSDWFVQYQDPLKPPPVDAWGKVIAEAERRGLVRQAQVGEAACLFFKAAAVVGIYEEMLRTDPFKLFGMERKSGPTSL
jgi:aminoglycoside N3'-acetyltransferase